MHKILASLLCVSWVLLIAVPASHAKAGMQTKSDDIPFSLYNGYLIVVEGQIGNLNHLRFGIDTGITHTTVDARVAKALAVRLGPGTIVDFDRKVSTKWSVVPDLAFGPIHMSKAPVMVGDLKYLESTATHVDAMIGLDVLRLRDFSIDYREKYISFGPASSVPQHIPMQSDSLCLTVEATVAGQPARLIVDTGLQGVVMYADRLADRGISFMVKGEINGASLGGQLKFKTAIAPPLRIGMQSIDRQVVLAESPGDKFLPGVQGFLGTSAMKAQRLHFDFAENVLSWSD